MISLSEPFVTGQEIISIKKSLKKKEISTYGITIKQFEKKFSSFISSKYSLALNSGTSALHVALKVVGVKSGSEVIVSTLTFAFIWPLIWRPSFFSLNQSPRIISPIKIETKKTVKL